MKKTIVISGATKGLGRELAKYFARENWIVYGCGNDRRAVDTLNREFGSPHRFHHVDVCDFEQVDAWSRNISDACETPDIVFANAGVINTRRPAWELSSEEFARCVNVNLVGIFNMTKAFIPLLMKQPGSCMINISSGWGRYAAQGLAPYCATKFAVEGFTKSLALDVSESVRVYPLDPGGGIQTDMLKSCLPDAYREYQTPEQWAPKAYDYIVNTLPSIPSGTSVTVPGDIE